MGTDQINRAKGTLDGRGATYNFSCPDAGALRADPNGGNLGLTSTGDLEQQLVAARALRKALGLSLLDNLTDIL